MSDVKESNYYKEPQGMMLAAMNAVTILAIEQSMASGVKTGEESQKKTDFDMCVDYREFVVPVSSDAELARGLLVLLK